MGLLVCEKGGLWKTVFIGERVVFGVADYDVVQQLDSQKIPCGANSLGECPVFRAWRRITRRMVVNQDDCGCVCEHRDLEQFPRMRQRLVQRPDRHLRQAG